MENNKLLIGVQFTDKESAGGFSHTNIELYVVRDITLFQLLEGIKYGIAKLAKENGPYKNVYVRCFDIFQKCIYDTVTTASGQEYYKHITFTAFNAALRGDRALTGRRLAFTPADLSRALCDLGFITSTKIIFDATGQFEPKGMLDTEHLIEAFDPHTSGKIFFPEYNISTRQLYRFDDTPVSVIAPTDPPQPADRGLFGLLLPSLCSIGVMVLLRTTLSTSSNNVSMALMSVGMGMVGVVTTIINWNRQKKQFKKDHANWRSRYENYVTQLMASVKKRQADDAAKLKELYPDIHQLINRDGEGVYALNENVYSRSPSDEDFLSFRIGLSDQVPSKFPVKGESRETVFSDTFFRIEKDASFQDNLKIICGGNGEEYSEYDENLSALPGVLSKKYRFLENAPLLYSLKHKSCLGIVDRSMDEAVSRSGYFISRMIFELCYYHSPEDLQFVLFFRDQKEWEEIENTINRYKFMPHFRELFSDKSQFVFDNDSSHMVMNSLLTMMNARKAASGESENGRGPHVVMVVFDDHGMKEHAFAEYLPKVPEDGAKVANELGLTFVFVAKYKEYLPAYCDDVVCFGEKEMTLTPHFDISARKVFRYEQWDNAADRMKFIFDYTVKVTHAMRFLSSVYYARIAQNGRVPSTVSMFEMLDRNDPVAELEQMVRENWGIGVRRKTASITKSLAVPIGKTETGIAYLDLHEKADGPHMLVAGTTGSGKSETIISYLLGLSLLYRPDELNMLLVDMKGGGFTKRIGHLPHVVGTVTDVDGDENGTSADYMLRRFLDAMTAEIKRRKLLFNKMRVDSIDAYIKACADINAHLEKHKHKLTDHEAEMIRKAAEEEKLSHLILVVDEFTELKRFTSENGDLDFMGEITTIARVGRSLGFHIILISQNIEGAITEDIRVNSKARLCLKVATRQASKDMIGTDVAASPFMPGNGRAYLLVGTGSKFEYFQSAYSGAGMEERIPVEITLANKIGAYTRFYRSDKDNLMQREKIEELKRIGAERSQLEVITDAICKTYGENRNSISDPHIVFSAPLSGCIAWDREKNTVIDLNKRK